STRAGTRPIPTTMGRFFLPIDFGFYQQLAAPSVKIRIRAMHVKKNVPTFADAQWFDHLKVFRNLCNGTNLAFTGGHFDGIHTSPSPALTTRRVRRLNARQIKT